MRRRRPLQRKKHFTHKARLTLRAKTRPKGSLFGIEIKTRPVSNIPSMMMYGGAGWISSNEKELYAELQDFTNTVRTNIGGRFKIVQQKTFRSIKTKILLEREADLFYLTLAHPTMICRAYRYVD